MALRVKMVIYDETSDVVLAKVDEPYTNESDVEAAASFLNRRIQKEKRRQGAEDEIT